MNHAEQIEAHVGIVNEQRIEAAVQLHDDLVAMRPNRYAALYGHARALLWLAANLRTFDAREAWEQLDAYEREQHEGIEPIESWGRNDG